MTEIRAGAPLLTGPRRSAVPVLVLVGLGGACALAALPFEGAAPRPLALAIYAFVAAVVLYHLGRFHPHGRFGFGNAITLFRAAGTILFGALAFEPALLAGSRAWVAVAGVATLLLLDGLDGWAARRQGLASAFGARFDLEVDAGLILALSLLALGLGKAGPFVLALGLMRYAFVLAGRLRPALARPLPPSERRRAVCGLQIAALGVVLAPPVTPPLSSAIAAAALLLLVWSFAADIAWLLRGTPR